MGIEPMVSGLNDADDHTKLFSVNPSDKACYTSI
jgi:hypothetical protein